MENQAIKRFLTHIPEIERVIDYTFSDKTLLRQAFTRSTFCNENQIGCQSNEVMEFFGDSVLSATIASFLIRDFCERYEHGVRTELQEGDLNNIKSKLSDKQNLSKSMRALGLQKYLLMGNGDRAGGKENEPSVMEDLFESIVGAIYIDCGMQMQTVMHSVARMMDVGAFFSKAAPPTQSSKNDLQNFCQDKRRRLPLPRYETVEASGPDHERWYRVACFVGDRMVAYGGGKNTAAAEKEAAREALCILEREDSDTEGRAEPTGISPIQRLYEYAAKTHTPPPKRYEEDLSQGSEPRFRVTFTYNGMTAVGEGRSKGEAKENAATEIVERLNILD